VKHQCRENPPASSDERQVPSDNLNLCSDATAHPINSSFVRMTETSPNPPAKRRRVDRVTAACDLCKKRKVKCDGVRTTLFLKSLAVSSDHDHGLGVVLQDQWKGC
jgi:hypothetical protein